MRMLVAGIGNIFLGDDAFGVEVVRALVGCGPLEAPGARLVDFGVRAFDLACALAEGWDEVVLVDAAPRGGAPGTIYVIEPEMPAAPASPDGAPLAPETAEAAAPALDGHSLDPVAALALARALGGAPIGRLRIVACEPARLLGPDDDIAPGLSPAVQDAIAPAAALVRSLVREALAGSGAGAPAALEVRAHA